MPWLQLHIETQSEHVTQLSDVLSELGAISVTWQDNADDPFYEPPPGETPIWPYTLVVALFDVESDMQAIQGSLTKQFSKQVLENLKLEALEDKDWVRNSMDQFEPLPFGNRLWIVPSWHAPPHADAVNILLDPGLAFGTGTHATTAMCLRWLDEHVPLHKTVVDYGCGSGVLGIAAGLLGAKEIYAVDNDSQALLATDENADKNQVECLSSWLPEELPPLQVDLLLANILAGPLQQLESTFTTLMKPGAQLVLSGILNTQATTVLEHYRGHFDMAIYAEQDEWVCLAGTKK